MKLWGLVQSGEGARALARFNIKKHGTHDIPSGLDLRALKRRERRAPLAPKFRHSGLPTAIGRLGCLLLVLGFASEAVAHRLDEYLQATRVAVATNRIDLSIDLTPGVAIADQVLAMIDQDHDGRISESEGIAYARRVLKDVRIGLDGKVLAQTLADISFPSIQEIRGGLGIIRIKATAPLAQLAPGKHIFSLTNAHLPAISVYLVNALVPKDPAIKVAKQTRDELQRNYQLEFRVNSPSP